VHVFVRLLSLHKQDVSPALVKVHDAQSRFQEALLFPNEKLAGLMGRYLQYLTEGNSTPVFKYALRSERKELKSMADGLHVCSIGSTCCFIHSSRSCGDGSDWSKIAYFGVASVEN
jgi:hypothetical protein